MTHGASGHGCRPLMSPRLIAQRGHLVHANDSRRGIERDRAAFCPFAVLAAARAIATPPVMAATMVNARPRSSTLSGVGFSAA